MKKKSRSEPVPKERTSTIRQEIIRLLEEETLSVSDLSKAVGKSEKEIVGQLSHIQKSVRLKITPAECLSCGFEFRDRTRTKKPGRCPKCRQSRIAEPLFTIPG